MKTSFSVLVSLFCLLIVPALADNNEVYSVLAGHPVSYSSKSPEKDCDIHRLDAQGKGWCPETDDKEQWVQVSSMIPELWVGVVTQGVTHADHKVTEYMVASTLDGREWTFVDKGRIFSGNSDRTTQMRSNFDQPVLARAIKLIPLKWHIHIHIRWDFIFRRL